MDNNPVPFGKSLLIIQLDWDHVVIYTRGAPITKRLARPWNKSSLSELTQKLFWKWTQALRQECFLKSVKVSTGKQEGIKHLHISLQSVTIMLNGVKV